MAAPGVANSPACDASCLQAAAPSHPARALCRAEPENNTPLNARPVTYIGTPGTSTLSVEWLDDIDSNAVCNDGSPAAYYFAPGSGDGANTWLVFLEVRLR